MYEVTVCSAKGETLRRFDLSSLRQTGPSGGRAVIGRAEDCDIRVRSGAISRHHCAIVLDDGDWLIRDLGSTHGTLVEGVQISEAAIVDGLEVVIGPAVLRFSASKRTTAQRSDRIAAEIARELGQ